MSLIICWHVTWYFLRFLTFFIFDQKITYQKWTTSRFWKTNASVFLHIKQFCGWNYTQLVVTGRQFVTVWNIIENLLKSCLQRADKLNLILSKISYYFSISTENVRIYIIFTQSVFWKTQVTKVLYMKMLCWPNYGTYMISDSIRVLIRNTYANKMKCRL